MKADREEKERDITDGGATSASSQTVPGWQQVISRLERIEAAMTNPRHMAGNKTDTQEPKAMSSLRPSTMMERIACALQAIARVHRPGTTDDPPTGHPVSSPAVPNVVLGDDQLDRGQAGERASENGVHSHASLEAQLDEIRSLLKQERAAHAADKAFCTVQEVAELTKYKPWTIRQACNQGRIKGKKGDDGRWRIPREEVHRLQQAGLPKG